MADDIGAEIADQIATAQVFGSSENIRHGRYRFLIKRIFAQAIEVDAGKNRFAFWEFRVLKSEPNPQVEGDKTPDGKLIDDGTKPNAVGSDCALKINFDGPAARSAGGNIQQPILALFNRSEISPAELKSTWLDLQRTKSVKKGDMIGFNPQTNQPIYADEDKIANPACGMIIDCHTMAKKKKKANDKGAYITKLIFTCAAPIGERENAPELVAQRRQEIELHMTDDDEEETTAPQGTSTIAAPTAPQSMPGYAPPAPQAAPQAPPPAPPAPPAPPVAAAPWVPKDARWVPLPNHPVGPTPDTRWYWCDPARGGDNGVKNESQLRAAGL